MLKNTISFRKIENTKNSGFKTRNPLDFFFLSHLFLSPHFFFLSSLFFSLPYSSSFTHSVSHFFRPTSCLWVGPSVWQWHPGEPRPMANQPHQSRHMVSQARNPTQARCDPVQPSSAQANLDSVWTRVLFVVLTSFRRRLPHLCTPTWNCCHIRRTRVFESQFRDP